MSFFPYSYMWLDDSGTPYYVGKGCGGRGMNPKLHADIPYPRHYKNILIFEQESERDALESEKALIELFGCRVAGTGTLLNKVHSGDTSHFSPKCKEQWINIRSLNHGTTKGHKLTEEHKEKLRQAALRRWDRHRFSGKPHPLQQWFDRGRSA